MRPDPETCRDPDLLAAEVRRLRAVIDSGVPALTDEERQAEPSPASAGSQRDTSPLFSKRLQLSKLAEEWCDGNRAPHHPLNIVTALFSMGLVSLRPTITSDEP